MRNSKFVYLFCLCSLLPLSSHVAAIEVDGAWVRAAPPTAKVLAAYMKLSNHTQHTVTLTMVSSPQFAAVEIHRSTVTRGMMKMKRYHQMDIAPHNTLHLKPGGYHLMLIEPKNRVTLGSEITLDLTFSDNSTDSIKARVRHDDKEDDLHETEHHHH